MAELTEQEYKEAASAVVYYEREVAVLEAEVANQLDKADRSDADAAAARAASAAAADAVTAMRATIADATALHAEATVAPDSTSTAGPVAGAQAADAAVVTDNDVSALDTPTQ